jgi:hypothetical protein
MKLVSWIGLLLLVLGILAFVVPVPRSETHKMKVGDASFGITTKSEAKLPPAVGVVLCASGGLLLVLGARR